MPGERVRRGATARKLPACLLLVGSSASLATASLALGWTAAAPCLVLVASLLLVGVRVGRGPLRIAGRWLVGSGLLAALAGFALALAGAGLIGWLSAATGAAVIAIGAWMSLALEPPPEPVAPGVSPGLLAAAACDEAGRVAAEVTARLFGRWSMVDASGVLGSAVARYRERGWIEEPWRAHPEPPPLDAPSVDMRHVRGLGACEHVRFESGYEPYDPEVRDWYLDLEPNRSAHAFVWRHSGSPRPTVICLHGYLMGQVAFDARAFDVRRLHQELGLDVAMAILPLHGPRSIGRWSGAGLFDGHPLVMNAMLGHAIWDVRRLCDWLRATGVPALGLYGMSLGGYLAALLASLEDDIACVVPTLPVSCFGSLIWRDFDDRERRAHAAAGIDEALLEDLFAPNAPLRMQARVPMRGRLVVAAAADRVCPPSQALALWEHWGRPDIWWSPCSHLIPRRLGAERARIAGHLSGNVIASKRQQDWASPQGADLLR